MADPNEMTFLEHLEELRWRVLKSLAAIIIFTILAFIKADWLIDFLTAPALNLDEPVNLQALKVPDTFLVQLIASLMTGLVVASPVVIYQAWRFVEPAMQRSSRNITISVVLFSSFFLVVGVSFGYLVLLPFSLRFFTALGEGMVESNYSIRAYLSYVVWMMLAAGMVFQLPVISFILTRIGLLTPAFLRKYRKFALIGILVFAAVLTPPDPISQMFMAVPLLGLYELSIIISKVFTPKEVPEKRPDTVPEEASEKTAGSVSKEAPEETVDSPQKKEDEAKPDSPPEEGPQKPPEEY